LGQDILAYTWFRYKRRREKEVGEKGLALVD